MNVMTLLVKGHHPLGASVAIAIGLLLLTLPIVQALTFGSAIRITTNTGDSVSPSVATDGSGHVYVAWQDNTPVTGSGYSREIWMRASPNNGASFGSAIRITTNTGASLYPSVAASGTYVYVAWQDDTSVTGSGGNPEIWLRVSNNYGASFGPTIRITTNTGNSREPSVAAVGGYVYVTWDDDTPVTGSMGTTEVWMRVSSNYGASFGSAIRITHNTASSGFSSVAAVGNYVYVTWEDDTAVAGSGYLSEIWFRVSPNNGGSFGSPVRISYNTYQSMSPSVAAYGNYVYVAWMDNTPVTGSGTDYEVWMRVSSNYGASFGSAIRLTTNTGTSGFPSVAAVGTNVYVAWMDNTPVPGSGSDGGGEIWLRVSSNNGANFGSAIRITTNIYGSVNPSVAASVSHVYVAWDDQTPVPGSGSDSEIWLRVGS